VLQLSHRNIREKSFFGQSFFYNRSKLLRSMCAICFSNNSVVCSNALIGFTFKGVRMLIFLVMLLFSVD